MAVSTNYQTLSLTRPGGKREHTERTENEDRVLVREFSTQQTKCEHPAVLVAVADGVSRCADGGAVAEWLLRQVESDEVFADDGEGDLARQFHDYTEALRARFIDEFASQPDIQESGCTFAAALIFGDKGAAFWAGDSPIHLLSPNGARFKARTLTIADKDPFTGALTDCFSGLTPFKVKQAGFAVKNGDIVIAVSDGMAYDGQDLAGTLDRHGFNQEWVDAICQQSFDMPFSDDISIAAVKIGERKATEKVTVIPA